MGNNDQKRQKDNPNDKLNTENKKKGFQPPPPKPFNQFSSPNKFGGNPSKGFGGGNTFHRRTPGGK